MAVKIVFSTAATGTVDAIVLTYTPAVTSLTNGRVFAFQASGANISTTPTVAVNATGAKTLVKKGGLALVAGDIPGAEAGMLIMYDLANDRYELMNPGGDTSVTPDLEAVLTAGTSTGDKSINSPNGKAQANITDAQAQVAYVDGPIQNDLVLTGTQTVLNFNDGTDTGKVDMSATRMDITHTQSIRFDTPSVEFQDSVTGVTDGSSAPAGKLGEIITQSRLRSAATALTTATAANVTATALTLTAGDWEVVAHGGFLAGTGTSLTVAVMSVSLTSATLPASDTTSVPTNGEIRMQNVPTASGVVLATNGAFGLNIPSFRVSINTPTTYYLVAFANFTVSTLSAFGSITARRVR